MAYGGDAFGRYGTGPVSRPIMTLPKHYYIATRLRSTSSNLVNDTTVVGWKRSVFLIVDHHRVSTPSPKEGLRVSEICYKKLTVKSVACRGGTWGPKYNPKRRHDSSED